MLKWIQGLEKFMFHEPDVFICEKCCACFGLVGAQLCRLPPTFPLYYEGKVKKTFFPQKYVYVLRTTTTPHMVSFINFYFHFLANFSHLNFASYVLYVYPCYVTWPFGATTVSLFLPSFFPSFLPSMLACFITCLLSCLLSFFLSLIN